MSFYGSFRGELLNVLGTELLLAVGIWKTRFSYPVTGLYLIGGIFLLVLLLRAHRLNTMDSYEFVGKAVFVVFLVDTAITLMRLA